ncbi:MAG: DUF58 domain-containing protein, partial [Desulfobacula sp.]|nr:DUF58 domain-containing protein [Desulfobacula sp.]
VKLYDKGTFELPFNGIVTLSDFETDKEMVFDAFNQKTRKKFAAIKQADHQKTLGLFSQARSDVIELETSASVSDTLSQYFRLRERRFR